MALSSATLSTQLQAISGGSEAAAIAAWSSAWATYFAGAATSTGVAFTNSAPTIAAARAAMEAQMTGLTTAGLGDDKVQAGIIGWWDYLVANPGSCFTGATAIAKPGGLTGIAAALPAIFDDNKNNARSAAVSCDAIATSIHGNNASGTATIGGIARTIS